MAVVRRSRVALIFIAFGLILAAAAPAQAAAPANDAFASAATLTEGAGAVLYDNVGSSSEASEPDDATYGEASDCAAISDRTNCGSTVWFRFTPATTGSYTLGTCDQGTDLDTVMNVYTGGTLATLTPVTNNDDACAGGFSGNGSQVTFPATAGTPYSVQVEGYGNQQGAFYLRADPGNPSAAPANDTIIDRYQSVPDALNVNQRSGVHSGPRATATFAFSATDRSSTFECSLDGGAFAACTSPVSYDDVTAEGPQHTFLVRATAGGVTDATPAAERFTIDTTPPDTAFGATPAEGSSTTNPVSVTEGSSERTYDNFFTCGVDSLAIGSICGPASSYGGFCNGPHTVSAAAIDDATNVDPTPATRSFTIIGGSACAAPGLVAQAPTTYKTAVQVPALLTPGGQEGTATFRLGTTTDYGEIDRQTTAPNDSSVSFISLGLLPNTLYHYVISVTTASGTATTGDQTFTTLPLAGGDALPSVTVGAPVLVGLRAARIPVSTDVGAPASTTSVDVELTDPAHPDVYVAAVSARALVPSSAVGQQSVPVDLLDLKPATTYHYRVLVRNNDTGGVMTEARTFTTPPVPVPAPPTTTTTATTPPVTTTPAKPIVIATPKAFKLTRGQVTIAKVKRTSRSLVVKVKGAPIKTKLVVTFKGRKTLVTAHKTARTTGTTTFRIKLSAKARKALRSRKLRRVTFVVAATPPLQKRSSVTIAKTLPK